MGLWCSFRPKSHTRELVRRAAGSRANRSGSLRQCSARLLFLPTLLVSRSGVLVRRLALKPHHRATSTRCKLEINSKWVSGAALGPKSRAREPLRRASGSRSNQRSGSLPLFVPTLAPGATAGRPRVACSGAARRCQNCAYQPCSSPNMHSR